jgi:hypothetical protein
MFIKACLNGSRKLGDLCWLLLLQQLLYKGGNKNASSRF